MTGSYLLLIMLLTGHRADYLIEADIREPRSFHHSWSLENRVTAASEKSLPVCLITQDESGVDKLLEEYDKQVISYYDNIRTENNRSRKDTFKLITNINNQLLKEFNTIVSRRKYQGVYISVVRGSIGISDFNSHGMSYSSANMLTMMMKNPITKAEEEGLSKGSELYLFSQLHKLYKKACVIKQDQISELQKDLDLLKTQAVSKRIDMKEYDFYHSSIREFSENNSKGVLARSISNVSEEGESIICDLRAFDAISYIEKSLNEGRKIHLIPLTTRISRAVFSSNKFIKCDRCELDSHTLIFLLAVGGIVLHHDTTGKIVKIVPVHDAK